MTDKLWCVRQGDVLIVRDDEASGTDEIKREDSAVVLAYGEATGHKHQIRAPGVCHLRAEGIHAHTVLRVDCETVDLVHEEHATIAIPKGTYRVVIQQEYAPDEYRNVMD